MNIPAIINLFHVSRAHFVHEAYATILGRKPDSSGSVTFDGMLGRGTYRLRRKIILAMSRSPEARVRNHLLPMIAKEAVRIQRWRFLPWNRSAIAVAASATQGRCLTESFFQSLEYKLDIAKVKLENIEIKMLSVLESTERKMHSLQEAIEWKLHLAHEKLETIEWKLHQANDKMETANWKIHMMQEKLEVMECKLPSQEIVRQSDEKTLPLIEHTMQSLKGLAFSLHRLENKLLPPKSPSRSNMVE